MNILEKEARLAVDCLTASIKSIRADVIDADEQAELVAESQKQFREHVNDLVLTDIRKRKRGSSVDDDGRHGRTPKDHDRQHFKVGGSGPITEKLWVSYDNLRRSMPAREQQAFAIAWSGLSDIEKDQIRTEEAAAEAARAAAVTARQKEQESEMRAELYADLKKRATAQRQPGESPQQALSRYVGTAEGRQAFEKYKNMPGDDSAIAAPVTPAPVVKLDGAYGQLRRIAEEMCKGDKSLTMPSAIVKIAADPKHRELWDLAKNDSGA